MLDGARLALLQKKIDWPQFDLEQIRWLRANGFNLAPLDYAKLAFEEFR